MLSLLCNINAIMVIAVFLSCERYTGEALFDFYKHKNCTCLGNKVLVLISTCCHHSVVK